MEITAKYYEIEVTHSDLWDIAFYVRDSLYHTLESHWVNHQNAWKEHEKQRLYLLKTMFTSLARPEIYEQIEKDAQQIFLEYNKKRGSA